MTDILAKFADIGHRNKRPKKSRLPDIVRFQLNQLQKLIRHRGQSPLPDEQCSRRYLQALIDLGLTGPDAKRLAPWLPNAELADMIACAVVNPGWNKRTLGDLFELTKKEKLDLGLRNIECFDADTWEYRAALAERRRLRDAERQRRKRARSKENQMTEVDSITMRAVPPGTPWNMIELIEASYERQRLLYRWASGKGWMTVYQMARGSLPGDVPVYEQRNVHSVERTLRRDIEKLISLDLFESKVTTPANGGPPRRVFRQAVAEAVDEDTRTK